jgi:signal transduction histidine kinase
MEGLRIDLSAPEKWPPLPAAYDVAIFRIVCEALTNVSRHAGATKCDIKLRLGENGIHLDVSDNGRGISDNHRAGVGVNSMRDRVTELGGGLEVRARDVGGTLVTAFIPVDLAAAAAEVKGMASATIW